MQLMKGALSLILLTLGGYAQADDFSVSKTEQSFLDSFSGVDGEWMKVSKDIFASESNGARTVVYRNAAMKDYIALLNAKIEKEIGKVSATRDGNEIAAREKYIDSLMVEIEELQAEMQATAPDQAKGTQIVGWDQGLGCGWILYADAELSFFENLTNSASVTSTFNVIGSGPQFGPPPPSLPTRMYRHVRSTIDPSSLGTPINDVASSRANSAPIQVGVLDQYFWGDACVLTSTRTVSLRGGSCSGIEGAVAVTTRNCSDL